MIEGKTKIRQKGYFVGIYRYNLLAELKNRLKISIFLWRKKLCISLIFSNFVVSNYKVYISRYAQLVCKFRKNS